MRDKNVGRYIVPIVPDEARTFGMEALFRQFGIYSHAGQLYQPVDSDTVLYYREATDGQILEEGITEAGSLSSFIAAGSSRSSHGLSMIPFFIYYSMFGFQRIGDLLWAAGDMRCRGFVLGGTAGRTTLAGEGLQHQDGNSHLNALAYPNCAAYDPCYAYEMAVIVLDGLRRMFYEQEDIFYYITLMNENYEMPILPMGSTEGICRGIYRLSTRGCHWLGQCRCGCHWLGQCRSTRAPAGQRRDPPRSAPRPGSSGTTLRRRQRRVQRYELQEPLLRRPRLRPLEPPAPGGAAARTVRHQDSRGGRRPDRRRAGLRQCHRPVDRAVGDHGWAVGSRQWAGRDRGGLPSPACPRGAGGEGGKGSRPAPNV